MTVQPPVFNEKRGGPLHFPCAGACRLIMHTCYISLTLGIKRHLIIFSAFRAQVFSGKAGIDAALHYHGIVCLTGCIYLESWNRLGPFNKLN